MKYKTYTDPKIENQQTKHRSSFEGDNLGEKSSLSHMNKTVESQGNKLDENLCDNKLSNESPDFIQLIKEGKIDTIQFDWKGFEKLKRKVFENGKKQAIEDEIKFLEIAFGNDCKTDFILRARIRKLKSSLEEMGK